MPNTLLTATQITREALVILHQKLNFVGSITRDYDDSYAKPGAKIGDTLKIRLPNQYTVRSGAALSAQARSEVDAVKRALGERGPAWWADGAPDFNRRMAANTPYAAWYAALEAGKPA